MAALDFPSSPTNGQVYNGYTYDSTKGVWAINSSTITNMTVSDTAPSNPLSGDSWFDSTTGYVFVYYTDADSSQWVQTTGSYIDTALTNRVTNVESKAALTPNAIINGDFSINQRVFSSTTTSGAYGFDRWKFDAGDGTTTYSAQTFTAGTAPVAGYEAQNFARLVTSGQSAAGAYAVLNQKIEDVRTFAGQTVTVSFWAKAASGTPKVSIEFAQQFGSGGSPSAEVDTYAGQVTLSTSWARYSVTVAVPSIAGKTIGTTANTSSLGLDFWTSAGSTYNARSGTLGIQNVTIDFWGVQVEAGAVATAFRRAGNTLQAELAACQRYYEKSYDVGVAPGTASNVGMVYGSQNVGAVTTGYIGGQIVYKVTKRIPPTTVTLYDALGAAGKCQRFILGTTTNQGQTIYADTGSGNTNVTLVYSSGTASAAGLGFQFTSDAEIN